MNIITNYINKNLCNIVFNYVSISLEQTKTLKDKLVDYIKIINYYKNLTSMSLLKPSFIKKQNNLKFPITYNDINQSPYYEYDINGNGYTNFF